MHTLQAWLVRSLLLISFLPAVPNLAVTYGATQTAARGPKPLAVVTFNLTQEMEVGLEVDARAPGASWETKGAEACDLLISVDGEYNQDLMLWSGNEMMTYRVMLGRFSNGQHTVTVVINTLRSAANAHTAEVKALRPRLLGEEKNTTERGEVQLAQAYAPVLYARANTIDRFTDIPLLMYYEILHESAGVLTVRYSAIFTNEDGGTQTAALMARWGRATDIEWVYQFRAREGKVFEESYQGVEHETKFFTGQRSHGHHPLLAVASDNNNFSDLACSAVRFAPLPVRARLETATRESMMDLYPQTYRAMTRELIREHRISETPTDINTIVDPREYLYIEAVSTQEGATLAFDAKVSGQPNLFASDMGDPRLRIDRSGYFRTAVRLPSGVQPSQVESVTARCNAGARPAVERRCDHLKLVRVIMLDQDFVPRDMPLKVSPEASLAPEQTKVFPLSWTKS